MISFNPKSLLLPINTYLQFFSFLHGVLNGLLNPRNSSQKKDSSDNYMGCSYHRFAHCKAYILPILTSDLKYKLLCEAEKIPLLWTPQQENPQACDQRTQSSSV